jgi:hypothetical protein
MILQQPAVAPPPPPAPPAPPAFPAPSGGGTRVVVQTLPARLSNADLRARRSELSNQLQSANSRRNQIARELRRAEPNTADRAGLEARLQGLDQRIIQLEADLAETGRMLALRPAGTETTQPARGPFRGRGGGRDVQGIGLIMAFALLLPFVWGAARRFFRQPIAGSNALVDHESRERLARLETAVDAIAIEVERVAEGQRFVTKLLSDSAAAHPLVAANAQREALPMSARPGER